MRLDDLRGCIPEAIAISSKVKILHFESALLVYYWEMSPISG